MSSGNWTSLGSRWQTRFTPFAFAQLAATMLRHGRLAANTSAHSQGQNTGPMHADQTLRNCTSARATQMVAWELGVIEEKAARNDEAAKW